jgi:hypothetical protein
VRTLVEIFNEGGAGQRFAEEFVQVHGGWGKAKDHWTRTVEYISNNVKELDDLKPRAAARRAEDLARALALTLMQAQRCWACSI